MKNLIMILGSFILLVLLLGIPQQMSSQHDTRLAGVPLPTIGSWNGFSGHIVIAECYNHKNTSALIDLILKDQTGIILAEEQFVIPPLGTHHLIFNRYGITNKYGIFELKSGLNNTSVSCVPLTYKMNNSSNLEYATASRTDSEIRGKSSGVYNSFNPDPNSPRPVYNWLSVYNPGSIASFSGIIKVKDQSGITVQDIPVLISPGGRQDYPLGHPFGMVTGSYEIVPDSLSISYGAFLNRYSETSTGVFNFSIHLPASRGSTDSGLISASTMGPALNWAEIANTNPNPVSATITVFNRNGARLHERTIGLMPYAQHHEPLHQHIGNSNVGYFRVTATGPLIVQSLFYGFDTNNSQRINWAYNSIGTGGYYASAALPVNTYLNSRNWLKLFTDSTESMEVDIIIFGLNGRSVNSRRVVLSGSADIALHELTGPDFAGSVYVRSVKWGKYFQGEVVRVYMGQNGVPPSTTNTLLSLPFAHYQKEKCLWTYIDGGGESGINKNPELNANELQIGKFNQKPHVIWREGSRIRVAAYNGNSQWNFIDGGSASGLNKDPSQQNVHGPRITQSDEKLYATWTENNRTVVGAYNGNNWNYIDNFDQNSFSSRSHILYANGKLYITFLEYTQQTNYRIRVARYDETSSNWIFIEDENISGVIGDNNLTYPQLVHANGKLYLIFGSIFNNATQFRVLVYNGQDHNPKWSYLDGGGSYGINRTPTLSAHTRELAGSDGKLYATWCESSSPYAVNGCIVRVAVYNEGNNWSSVDQDELSGMNYLPPPSSAYSSKLIHSNGSLFLAWKEGVGIRISTYSGNNQWRFADGSGSQGIGMPETSLGDANSPSLVHANGNLFLAWSQRKSSQSPGQVRVAICNPQN
ncbi:MAG TPA: hypothetical protein PKA63_09860 [Oligoflexia bacterium]|nr:hypothetical protein [Oligoflexia bacterium]HMP48960.1 hypothetical protein [Oligoflexia bacterium]